MAQAGEEEEDVDAIILQFNAWREASKAIKDNSSRQKLRVEARNFFAMLVHSTTTVVSSKVKLTTKSSHNEALAKLIQVFGPIFKDERFSCRISALYCLSGAIDGTHKGGLSYKLMESLGRFLLGYCGPLEQDVDHDEDDFEEGDEMMRDAAIKCLSALLRIKDDGSFDDQKASGQMRLELAHQGVVRRCAASDENDGGYDHGYYEPEPQQQDDDVIAAGLSTLPRSRRTLCFELLAACVEGLVPLPAMPSLAPQLASFTTFAASCLHGESDPRCLQQLLDLFAAIQRSFHPHFGGEGEGRFPVLDLFDAVAPYYPVQFTPPPNDTHGITREGLHGSLMTILGCDDYSVPANQDSMLNLSAGIFLERVLPQDESSGTGTADDRLDGIQDLTTLLFPKGQRDRCGKLQLHTVKTMSLSLMTTHADAAKSVRGGSETESHKLLADATRRLASRVTASLEVGSDSSLWEAFVVEPLDLDVNCLASSPQSMKGRSFATYFASLASGGPRTMEICFRLCLPNLLEAMKPESGDEERMTAAAYEMIAFLSSYRVVQERGVGAGVSFQPHPLKPCCSKLLQALDSTLQNKRIAAQTIVASLKTMEALLLVAPASLFDATDVDVAKRFLEYLVGRIDSTEEDHNVGLQRTASTVLGSLIAVAMDAQVKALNTTNCLLPASDVLRERITSTVFPNILESSCHTTEPPGFRWDISTMITSCEQSKTVTTIVLGRMLLELLDAVQSIDDYNEDSGLHLARVTSRLLSSGGNVCREVLRSLVESSIRPIDILKALCTSAGKNAQVYTREEPQRVLRTGVSNLELPASSEEHQAAKIMIAAGYQIVPHLVDVYRFTPPEAGLLPLLDLVNHVLPPLSEFQSAQLCIALPVLSACLANADIASEQKATLKEMAVSLADFAIGEENEPTARSYAVDCVCCIVAKHQLSDDECVARVILHASLSPELHALLNDGGADAKRSKVTELLNIIAMLGGAAASRGKASTETSNRVCDFLVDLACSRKVQIPYLDRSANDTDETTANREVIANLAAGSYGRMLSLREGPPFWRQRMLYKATKTIMQEPDFEVSSGKLSLCCHIVINSEFTTLPPATVTFFAQYTAQGLNTYTDPSGAFLQLMISSAMKLLSKAPTTMRGCAGSIMTSLLLVLRDRKASVGSQLLALQGLALIVTVVDEHELLVVRDAVGSILAALIDHQSVFVRQAAAKARNRWYIVGQTM